MPNITEIVGGALGVIIILLGVWIGFLKIEVANDKAQIGVLSGQVEVASQQITKATQDIKTCASTNTSNQAVIDQIRQADADQLAAVTTDFQRQISQISAVQQEKGTIDADARQCPSPGGTSAPIRSAIDWLRRTAPTTAAAAPGGH